MPSLFLCVFRAALHTYEKCKCSKTREKNTIQKGTLDKTPIGPRPCRSPENCFIEKNRMSEFTVCHY